MVLTYMVISGQQMNN